MSSKPYIELWLILALSLTAIVLIAFTDDVELGSYKPKKAPVASLFEQEVNYLDSLPIQDSATDLMADGNKAATDSTPQSLFIFGDSMTYNLALRLAQYAKQNGHEIHSVNWDSSNTKIWADHDTLSYYLRKFKPTQVFVSLGSNELYINKPETRLSYIKKIIEVIDTIPYVWIGPPNWKEDYGINNLLERVCGSDHFFRTAGMEFKRKRDNIHPTREASALWVDSIMRWIPKSAHPFLAELPSDSIKKANPNIVFLKALNK